MVGARRVAGGLRPVRPDEADDLSELYEAFEKNPELKSASRERLHGAIASVLVRAQDAGDVRDDVEAEDVMQLLGPMCTSPTLSLGQIERLLGVAEDGCARPPRRRSAASHRRLRASCACHPVAGLASRLSAPSTPTTASCGI